MMQRTYLHVFCNVQFTNLPQITAAPPLRCQW